MSRLIFYSSIKVSKCMLKTKSVSFLLSDESIKHWSCLMNFIYPKTKLRVSDSLFLSCFTVMQMNHLCITFMVYVYSGHICLSKWKHHHNFRCRLGRVCQLFASGVDVNLIDSEESQNTPLHWAASFGNRAVIQCLCSTSNFIPVI